jgi:hypothetical protein
MKDGQCHYCLAQYENTHEGHAKLGRCRKRCEAEAEASNTNSNTRYTLEMVCFTEDQIEALIECFGEVTR